VKTGGRLGCSDHEIVEFRILHLGSRVISRIKILDFKRANFGLFKELLAGILCVRALEGRGVQECSSLFKNHFLHAQERCIPLRKKSRKEGRRPTVLGSARTVLIFTRIQERDIAGWANPTWPNRTWYSISCAVMLGSGEGELGGENSLVVQEWAAAVRESGSLGCAVCVVFSPHMYCCCYCSLCLQFC